MNSALWMPPGAPEWWYEIRSLATVGAVESAVLRCPGVKDVRLEPGPTKPGHVIITAVPSRSGVDPLVPLLRLFAEHPARAVGIHYDVRIVGNGPYRS